MRRIKCKLCELLRAYGTHKKTEKKVWKTQRIRMKRIEARTFTHADMITPIAVAKRNREATKPYNLWIVYHTYN